MTTRRLEKDRDSENWTRGAKGAGRGQTAAAETGGDQLRAEMNSFAAKAF